VGGLKSRGKDDDKQDERDTREKADCLYEQVHRLFLCPSRYICTGCKRKIYPIMAAESTKRESIAIGTKIVSGPSDPSNVEMVVTTSAM
jgi:hypothetical protein